MILFLFLQKINKFNLIFFLIAVCHYILTFFYTLPYSAVIDEHTNFVYFITKICAFIVISLFWQLVSFVFQSYINKNQKVIEYTRYTLFYWVINLLTAYFTYPTTDYYSQWYYSFKYYNSDPFCHFTNQFIPILNYNIIPVDYSSAICSTFIYSLIFAYCIVGIKNFSSNKLHYLMIIPFCFPVVLMYNLLCSRTIYAAWLFIFVSFFIFFNRGKNISSYLKSITIGLLFGLLASFRTEFFVLIVLLPLFIFFMNIFNKKIFFIFVISSVFIFSFINLSRQKLIQQEYEVHNLAHIYLYYKSIDSPKPISEKDFHTLKKVYTSIDEENFDNEDFILHKVVNTNKKNNNEALKVLSKILIQNIVEISKLKIAEINSYYQCEKDIFEIFKLKINILETKNDKFTSYFLYGSKDLILHKLLQIIYNPFIVVILFVFSIIYGVVRRNLFFIFWGMIFLLLFFLTFITAPFFRYLYYFPYFLNVLPFSLYILVDILHSKKQIKNNI